MRHYDLTYLYRDASNYKARWTVIVRGQIALRNIEPFLISGEYFIPRRIGLVSLIPKNKNEDDHELHEIECIHPSGQSGDDLISAFDLIRRFRLASSRGWFID